MELHGAFTHLTGHIQDGPYAEESLYKDSEMHGVVYRASAFNANRIDYLKECHDPDLIHSS